MFYSRDKLCVSSSTCRIISQLNNFLAIRIGAHFMVPGSWLGYSHQHKYVFSERNLLKKNILEKSVLAICTDLGVMKCFLEMKQRLIIYNTYVAHYSVFYGSTFSSEPLGVGANDIFHVRDGQSETRQSEESGQVCCVERCQDHDEKPPSSKKQPGWICFIKKADQKLILIDTITNSITTFCL